MSKDLTKEYLNKILDSAIYFKKGNFPDMPLYNQKSIIDAFKAGAEWALANQWHNVKEDEENASSSIVSDFLKKNGFKY